MIRSTTACVRCGENNSVHRIWCGQCGAPINFPATRKTDSQASSAKKKLLYREILKDLNELSQHQRVSHETHWAIKSFYEEQVAGIEKQEEEQRKQEKLEELIVTARRAAHEGHFQNAIAYLHLCPAEDRDDYQVEQAIQEIQEKSDQREELLQAERQADVILGESHPSLSDSQLKDVQFQLERAVRLDSNNPRMKEALARVKSVIADKIVPAVAKPPEISPEAAALPIEPFRASFVEAAEDQPSPIQRLVDAASKWSAVAKPFLLDNVGWFVGAFLIVAGFVVLIVSFWGSIEQNRILMHTLVYFALAIATGMFFAAAYFMRLKYPQLENSSNVLLVIVALLIPLVFAAAILTTLVPADRPHAAHLQNPG
jgi:hypothetical protein